MREAAREIRGGQAYAAFFERNAQLETVISAAVCNTPSSTAIALRSTSSRCQNDFHYVWLRLPMDVC
jgi:hypothetical protein